MNLVFGPAQGYPGEVSARVRYELVDEANSFQLKVGAFKPFKPVLSSLILRNVGREVKDMSSDHSWKHLSCCLEI